MRILFIGDVFGRPGRDLLRAGLPRVIRQHGVDLVIANAENAAAGSGLTREIGLDLLRLGVDVLTSGNHVWDRKEGVDFVAYEPRLLRPVNYPVGVPGRGSAVVPARSGQPVGVVNVMGRVFMAPLDNPFVAVKSEVATVRQTTPIVIVDMHAEATSEKMAMAWHLDGMVTAVVGTHTHVQTADNRVLPGGTAYITDVGMTGPHDSIIGTTLEAGLKRFLTGMPSRMEVASGRPLFQAVIITADPATGRALAIDRLSLSPADFDGLGEGGT